MDLDVRRYDVIVVGGGIAGLSAAESLLETSGVRVGKLLVLEAGQRLVLYKPDEDWILFRWGGRTHTLEMEGGKVEMGANWIHGGRLLTVR